MPRNSFKPVHGHAVGSGRSATYSTWESMMGRCHRPTAGGYKFYGGRGIVVCDRWHSFQNFLADMGERPDGLSLDRIDFNGHYEKTNCRWATLSVQNANKRSARLITYRDRTQSMKEWAAELNINYMTLFRRLEAGWTTEKAFETPKQFFPWQPQEDVLIRAFYPNEGTSMCVRLPGRTRRAIGARARALSLSTPYRRRA